MNCDIFCDRLKLAIGDESNYSFAARCSMSEGTVRRYLRGENYPTLDTLAAMAKATGVRLAWLAANEGPMKLWEYDVPTETAAGSCCDPGASVGDNFVKIPRYKVDASAGYGAVIHSEQIVDHLAFRSDWVRHALGVPVSSLALINVTGDSMEPTLSNGDLILIDTSIHGVDDSGVYVLQFDGKLKVKRIHSKVDGTVDLISDNTRYPIETIQGELAQGLSVVGRVVWCGRRM